MSVISPVAGSISDEDNPIFEMGPDLHGDLRCHRPYFMVPLEASETAWPPVLRRITNYVIKSAQEPVTLLLRPADLLDASALAARIRAVRPAPDGNPHGWLGWFERKVFSASDGVAAVLRGHFSCDLVRLIDNSTGKLAPQLELRLRAELNQLIEGACLFDAGRFPDVPLPPALREVVEKAHLEGPELLKVNRQLLELALPKLIQKHDLPENQKGAVTDIYILSHGWHRNFFGAVAAYDRLVSRLAVLMHRQRLQSPQPYHPLFLTLHWNSDPGEDGWFDKSGQRSKDSFLANVEAVFDRPSAQDESQKGRGERFRDVFEDIYELFTRLSSPESRTLQDKTLKAKSHELAPKLSVFYLKDAASAPAHDKVAAAWSCYYQAQPRGVLVDQQESPRRYNSPLQAAALLLKFAIAVIGIGALLGLMRQWFKTPANLAAILRWLWTNHWVAPRLHTLQFWLGTDADIPTSGAWSATDWWLTALVVLLGATISLLSSILYQQKWRKAGPATGLPLFALAGWLPLQIVFALPAILTAVFMFFVGGPIALVCGWLGWLKVPLLFDERLGDRDHDPAHKRRLLGGQTRKKWSHIPFWLKHPAFALSWLARLPLCWLHFAVAADSSVVGLIDTLDSQLAFWEMQRHGAQRGRLAARFLSELLDAPEVAPFLGQARLHLIGHSFGGLVVANAARHLSLDSDLNRRVPVQAADFETKVTAQPAPQPTANPRSIHTLCLLQAALASSWFEGEKQLCDNISGALACIYSRYDVANGFYYPLANWARCAAGYVGLFRVGNGDKVQQLPMRDKPCDVGLFASLVEPPDLQQVLEERYPDCKKPWLINLDASRLIFAGSVPLGGGHDDIFKDDVVHLLWAVTRLRPANQLPPELTPKVAFIRGEIRADDHFMEPLSNGHASPETVYRPR